MKRTWEEISSLKQSWLDDPCWDIECTEGFEEYYDELIEFAGRGYPKDEDYDYLEDEYIPPTRTEAIDYFRRKADELETQLVINSVVKVFTIQPVGF